MLLTNLLPFLPMSLSETMVSVVAGLGAILLVYSIFLEIERRQDIVMFIGAACLFVYALFIGNKIFMVATAGLGIASLVEFIEIYLGLHKHSPEDLKKYKNLR